MEQIIKTCSACNLPKPSVDFCHNAHGKFGLHSRCRSCQKLASKHYYALNKQEIIPKIRAYQNSASGEAKRQISRVKWLLRPHNRIAKNIRQLIWKAMQDDSKSASSEILLGISYEGFKVYLENLFAPGMSWERRDEFHIDHIIPCAYFDLSDPYQQRLCFHYLNLRPVFAKDNLTKSSKLPENLSELLENLKLAVDTKCP